MIEKTKVKEASMQANDSNHTLPYDKRVPFPNEKKSQALIEEDIFMNEHGGNSSRAIYLIVEFLHHTLRGFYNVINMLVK